MPPIDSDAVVAIQLAAVDPAPIPEIEHDGFPAFGLAVDHDLTPVPAQAVEDRHVSPRTFAVLVVMAQFVRDAKLGQTFNKALRDVPGTQFIALVDGYQASLLMGSPAAISLGV